VKVEVGEVDRLLAGGAAAVEHLNKGWKQAGTGGPPEGVSGWPQAIWVLPLQRQKPVRGGDDRAMVMEA
jgi:hypothetical protein